MLLSIKILIKLDEREERKMEMFVKIKNMVGSNIDCLLKLPLE
jgi:hypothetical protein